MKRSEAVGRSFAVLHVTLCITFTCEASIPNLQLSVISENRASDALEIYTESQINEIALFRCGFIGIDLFCAFESLILPTDSPVWNESIFF